MPHRIVRVHLVQQILTDAFVRPDKATSGLLNVSRSDAILRQVATTKQLAEKRHSQLIVFPELSLPNDPTFRLNLRRWSQRQHCVVVASTYYKRIKRGQRPEFRPVSPVFIDGEEFEAEKCRLSPYEEPISDNLELTGGDSIKVFRDTPVGTLAVAVCSDAFTAELKRVLEVNKVDILCVPALQRRAATHFRTLCELARHTPDGVYIAYANANWAGHSDGGTSLFANTDRTLKNQLSQAGYLVGEDHEHVLMVPPSGRNLIVDVDLDMRRPAQGKTVHETPQIRTIDKDYARPAGAGHFIHTAPGQAQDRLRLVCFDADGTLTTGQKFSWRLLWSELFGEAGEERRKLLRTEYEQAVEADLTKRTVAYGLWCRKCCDEFRRARLTKRLVVALAKTARPAANLRETLLHIKQVLRCRLVLISGGIDIFTKTAIGEDIWNLFDAKYINRMSFSESEDELIDNIRPTPFDFQGKFEAIATESLQLGCPLAQVAFIGDELNDRFAMNQLTQAGGLSIAFGPDSSISTEEAIRIPSTDLRDVLPCLEAKAGRSIRPASTKAGVLANVQAIIEEWVNSCEGTQEPFPDDDYLAIVSHDRKHRKRVKVIVDRILAVARQIPERRELIEHIATCAVHTHDVGLFLPLSDFYPGGEEYGQRIKAELRRRRHHNIAGHVLMAAAGGELPASMVRQVDEIVNAGVHPKSKIIDTLQDTLRLLAQLTLFHDENENELVHTYGELDEACAACKEVLLSPETLQFIRAAIRVADRLDRSHRRFKIKAMAEEICLRLSRGENLDLPGVVRDSVAVADREVVPDDSSTVRIKHKRATFRNPDAQQVAARLFNERVLGRVGTDAPWYVRLLRDRHGVGIETVEVNAVRKFESQCDQKRLDLDRDAALRLRSFPLSSGYRDVLLCCGLGAWIKSVPLPAVACSGLTSSDLWGTLRHQSMSPFLILCQRDWSDSHGPEVRVERTTDLIDGYIRRGGNARRVKGLARDESGYEWDVFVPFVDGGTKEIRALLNCHVPASLGWDRDKVWRYAINLEKSVKPFENRICEVVGRQLRQFNEGIAAVGIDNASIGTSTWFESASQLQEWDLLSAMGKVWPESSVTVIEDSKGLFPAMTPVSIRVRSAAILDWSLSMIHALIESLSNVTIEVGACPEFPMSTLRIRGTVDEEGDENVAGFELLKVLSEKAEIVALLEDSSPTTTSAGEPERVQLARTFFNSLRGNGCDVRCEVDKRANEVYVDVQLFFLDAPVRRI
jgi:phosphoserine phosphatase/predicted amidohydrolase